jgi:hypothetical protein
MEERVGAEVVALSAESELVSAGLEGMEIL